MKELEISSKTKTELSIKQQKQIKHQFIEKIITHEGHIIWQINQRTLEVKKAEFSNIEYTFGGEVKKEIIIKNGFFYVGALNKKNALKKFNKGDNGSKYINENPLEL